MGCHILDPVFTALALTAPTSVRSEGGAPNADSWGLDSQVRYIFPGTKYTTDDADAPLVRRQPAAARRGQGADRRAAAARPGLDLHRHRRRALLALHRHARPAAGREVPATIKLPQPGGENHYLQFVEACRGNGKTSTPFDYSGPLTESVLLGCLATRFPQDDARVGYGRACR